MSARIIKLETVQRPTTLSRHLSGHHAQGPAPGGLIGRMQSESAVRAYVRWQARRNPLSDANNKDDIWQQVEDIAAMVPTLASSVAELDNFIHAMKRVLCARGYRRMAKTEGTLSSCHMEILANQGIFRLRMISKNEVRIITAKLTKFGADRLDDRVAKT